MTFHIILPWYGNLYIPKHWRLHGFPLTQNLKEQNLGIVCVSHTCSLRWGFTHPMVWELHGFLFHAKYVRNLQLWNVCVFPCFSLTMGINFSHVLGIAWISASREICMKLIASGCLRFPILFPYYGNSLFPCFGNCTVFCFTRNI